MEEDSFLPVLVVLVAGVVLYLWWRRSQVAFAATYNANTQAFGTDPGSGFGSPAAGITKAAFDATGVTPYLNWEWSGIQHPETIQVGGAKITQPGHGVGTTSAGVQGGVATVFFGPVGAIETIGKQGYFGGTVESIANKINPFNW